MSFSVEYVSHRLFVAGYFGRLHSNNYFRCFYDRCPFSVIMVISVVSGVSVASSAKKVILPVHGVAFHSSVIFLLRIAYVTVFLFSQPFIFLFS